MGVKIRSQYRERGNALESENRYALHVRKFAKVFGGAEVDMRFSLKDDLMSLKELFRMVHRRAG